VRVPESIVTARPSRVPKDGCVVEVGVVVDSEAVNLPVGRMSRSRLMGSCLKEIRKCVHGVGPGSRRVGVVVGTKTLVKAERAAGPKGVSLMLSWSWRQGAH
jgi:hypothetical protein